ncbi:tRNA (N6-threonylcarbamoyladenosine(37)-N6)-methyltransferase TrmO [bacterium]|nr:tRNA (N6-threonylcarbamoyladenosine(37)-N6)-methyltransferase TrmO [bacterium]
MEQITYTPIGIIHSPFTQQEGTPIQGQYESGDKRAEIEVFQEYADGLKDIEGFSHLNILFYLHLSKPCNLHQKPYLDETPHGVFAIRTPNRPNPIGLSVVRLIERKANRLIIAEFDILDGSPLLDIKPFIPDFEPTINIRLGWLSDRLKDSKKDDFFASSDKCK